MADPGVQQQAQPAQAGAQQDGGLGEVANTVNEGLALLIQVTDKAPEAAEVSQGLIQLQQQYQGLIQQMMSIAPATPDQAPQQQAQAQQPGGAVPSQLGATQGQPVSPAVRQ